MYASLDKGVQIRLAAEFIAREVPIPAELQTELGPHLMADLTTPERTIHATVPPAC